MQDTLYCWCGPDSDSEGTPFAVPFALPLPPLTKSAFQCPHCGAWLDVEYTDAGTNTAEESRDSVAAAREAGWKVVWASPLVLLSVPALWSVWAGRPVHPLMLLPLPGLLWAGFWSLDLVSCLWRVCFAARAGSVRLTTTPGGAGDWSADHEGGFDPVADRPHTTKDLELGLAWFASLPGFLFGVVIGVLVSVFGTPPGPAGLPSAVVWNALAGVAVIAVLGLSGGSLAALPSVLSLIESASTPAEEEPPPLWSLAGFALHLTWLAASTAVVLAGLQILVARVLGVDTTAWPWALPLGGIAGAALSLAWAYRSLRFDPPAAVRWAGGVVFYGLAPCVGVGLALAV